MFLKLFVKQNFSNAAATNLLPPSTFLWTIVLDSWGYQNVMPSKKCNLITALA